jgi:uncharacterized protein YndB with AHSA1/START domain
VTEPLRLSVRLPAPAGAVWRALTDATALRGWFAEHATTEPPGRYEFWGRFTPYGDRPAQRLLGRDDDALRFAWTIDGHETTVTIEPREEKDDTTVLTLSQTTFDGVIAGYPAALALMVFWSLALGNLTDHLMGRPITPRCDHTARDLRAEFVIGAPRDRVFASLTTPEEFGRWFGLPVEVEPYAGGRWSIGGGGPVGRVRDVRDGRRFQLQEDTGIATWDLADEGAGAGTATRVRFTLSGPDPVRPPYPGWTGWLSAMSSLRRYHELADWRPIWA